MSYTLLAGLLLSLPLQAFAVYKCETDGQTNYSDMPCPNGRQLDIATPLATDATGTKRQLAQEKITVKRLENERHKREAKEEKEQQRADHARASREKKCAALARRIRWAEEDAASAAGKSAEKNKRKARRLIEQHDADCPK